MARAVCLVALVAVLLGHSSVQAKYDHLNNYQMIVWNMIDNGFQSNYSHEIVDHIINFYLPASKAVQNQLCRRHSEKVKAALKKNVSWALRMLDASSKVPSGLLTGNTMQLGNYDECLKVESLGRISSDGHFMGQHCMVRVDLFQDDEATNNNTLDHDEVDVVIRDFAFSLGTKWSVCIPSSCTPGDLQAHLNSILKDMVGDSKVVVGENACRSRAHPVVLTPGDWISIVLFSVFIILVILSTAYDIRTKHSESRSKLLLAFSLRTNGRRLLTVSSGSSEELKALHAIRTCSMIWVVVGHTLDFSKDTPSINSEYLDEMLNDWKYAFLMSYRLAVDSFLLLSGLLLTYGFLKKAKRDKCFKVPLYYLHRYIRLTPAYAVMILLTATLLAYVDDGPLWEQHPIMERKLCQNYWWVNMIYLNNYVHQETLCMTQSWYLSLDMQLYILSPLLVYPLWRWRRFGKILLGLVGLSGLLINFLVSYCNELYNPDTEWTVNSLEYLPTHTRFTPWVLGIGMGYLMYSRRNKPFQLSQLQVAAGWVSCCFLILTPVVMDHILHGISANYNRWSEAIHAALNRPAFALGVAWLIFACNNGYGGILNTIFSWKLFTLLSRLTYCAYLAHYAVIMWMMGSQRVPLYYNHRTIAIKAFIVTVISIIAAILLSLFFEAPALNIEKIIFDKDDSKADKKATYAVKDGLYAEKEKGDELLEIIDCDNTSSKPEHS